MKKIVCLMASLLIVFCCLAGCDVNPEKAILGFWTGNPEMVDGVPLGSDMVLEFRNNGTGTKYAQYGVNEIQTPFTYSIEDGYVKIVTVDDLSISLKLEFKDGKMILTDESLNATEEYLKIDNKDDK